MTGRIEAIAITGPYIQLTVTGGAFGKFGFDQSGEMSLNFEVNSLGGALPGNSISGSDAQNVLTWCERSERDHIIRLESDAIRVVRLRRQ